jgi:hypothetical protein
MKVLAGGGNGGAGGLGGQGGNSTNPGPRAGNGGRGGDGGDGGDGGSVTVYYDAESPELNQLVLVDTGAGAGGAAGVGGYGGDADVPERLGQQGPEGRPGRAGRAGPEAQSIAKPGLSARLASMIGRSSDRVADVSDEPVKPTHDKKHPGKNPPPFEPSHGDKPFKVPPGHEIRPQKHTSDDGARQYVGDAQLELVLPKHPPQHRTSKLGVESTRTRKHHFSISFGDKPCQIDFHRPPGEKRHHYVIDGPTDCTDSGVTFNIKTATLDLDSEHDTLEMSWSGSVPMPGVGKQPPASVKIVYHAKRR